jgi:putative membrane protein
MLRHTVFLWHNINCLFGSHGALGGQAVRLVIYSLIWLLVFVVCVLIGARNGQIVEFNYLIAMGDFKLSSLLGIFLLIGFIIGAVTLFLFNLRIKLKLRWLVRERDKLKRQLDSKAPLKGDSI